MIDHFVIFSKTGLVLWSHTVCELKKDPIQSLINQVLLQDRSGEKKFTLDSYSMQWIFQNKLELVFVVVYQKILQLLYLDELLENVRKDFGAIYQNQLPSKKPIAFENQFGRILKEAELKYAGKTFRRGPRSFGASKKGALCVTEGSVSKQKASRNPSIMKLSIGDKTEEPDDGAEKEEFENLQGDKSLRTGAKMMRKGPGRKTQMIKSTATDSIKNCKKMTKWNDTKLSKKEILELDRSKEISVDDDEAQLLEKRKAYIGSASDSEQDNDAVGDLSSGAEESTNGTAWNFGNTRIGSFLTTITGNKIITCGDLEPVINSMRQLLISKNVAAEVADELCHSVSSTIVGTRLESFTRISTVVRAALEAALLRILTPKKSTDILREILNAKSEGRCYSIVFVGVNGVGKSTSLSKVCYYLKSKGVKLMIAACDTFRSGAVEQLNQHARVLDVPLFQKGYAKDPAAVAQEALKHGKDNQFDCVLIDTAGRMQNNEPLMRALAKLVSVNEPDLVLFVGEALVGNDGIDQLSLFDRALADYSDRREPHCIDGIVITKFDTIDDKVGAAVSMVYKTGQPIMFVGTGQKYTHLKKLNVQTVLRALLQ